MVAGRNHQVGLKRPKTSPNSRAEARQRAIAKAKEINAIGTLSRANNIGGEKNVPGSAATAVWVGSTSGTTASTRGRSSVLTRNRTSKYRSRGRESSPQESRNRRRRRRARGRRLSPTSSSTVQIRGRVNATRQSIDKSWWESRQIASTNMSGGSFPSGYHRPANNAQAEMFALHDRPTAIPVIGDTGQLNITSKPEAAASFHTEGSSLPSWDSFSPKKYKKEREAQQKYKPKESHKTPAQQKKRRADISSRIHTGSSTASSRTSSSSSSASGSLFSPWGDDNPTDASRLSDLDDGGKGSDRNAKHQRGGNLSPPEGSSGETFRRRRGKTRQQQQGQTKSRKASQNRSHKYKGNSGNSSRRNSRGSNSDTKSKKKKRKKKTMRTKRINTRSRQSLSRYLEEEEQKQKQEEHKVEKNTRTDEEVRRALRAFAGSLSEAVPSLGYRITHPAFGSKGGISEKTNPALDMEEQFWAARRANLQAFSKSMKGLGGDDRKDENKSLNNQPVQTGTSEGNIVGHVVRGQAPTTPAGAHASVQNRIGRLVGKNSLFYSYAESLRKQNMALKAALQDQTTSEDKNRSWGEPSVEKESVQNDSRKPEEDRDTGSRHHDVREEGQNGTARGIQHKYSDSDTPDSRSNALDSVEEDNLLAEWMRTLRKAINLERARSHQLTDFNSSPVRRKKRRRSNLGSKDKPLSDTEASQSLGLGNLVLGGGDHQSTENPPPRHLIQRQWQRAFEQVGIEGQTADDVIDMYLNPDGTAEKEKVERATTLASPAPIVTALLQGEDPRQVPQSVREARLLAAACKKAIECFKSRDTTLRVAYRDAIKEAQVFAATQKHRTSSGVAQRLESIRQDHEAELAAMKGKITSSYTRAKEEVAAEMGANQTRMGELEEEIRGLKGQLEDAHQRSKEDREYAEYQVRNESARELIQLRKDYEFRCMQLRLDIEKVEKKAQAKTASRITEMREAMEAQAVACATQVTAAEAAAEEAARREKELLEQIKQLEAKMENTLTTRMEEESKKLKQEHNTRLRNIAEKMGQLKEAHSAQLEKLKVKHNEELMMAKMKEKLAAESAEEGINEAGKRLEREAQMKIEVNEIAHRTEMRRLKGTIRRLKTRRRRRIEDLEALTPSSVKRQNDVGLDEEDEEGDDGTDFDDVGDDVDDGADVRPQPDPRRNLFASTALRASALGGSDTFSSLPTRESSKRSKISNIRNRPGGQDDEQDREGQLTSRERQGSIAVHDVTREHPPQNELQIVPTRLQAAWNVSLVGVERPTIDSPSNSTHRPTTLRSLEGRNQGRMKLGFGDLERPLSTGEGLGGGRGQAHQPATPIMDLSAIASHQEAVAVEEDQDEGGGGMGVIMEKINTSLGNIHNLVDIDGVEEVGDDDRKKGGMMEQIDKSVDNICALVAGTKGREGLGDMVEKTLDQGGEATDGEGDEKYSRNHPREARNDRGKRPRVEPQHRLEALEEDITASIHGSTSSATVSTTLEGHEMISGNNHRKVATRDDFGHGTRPNGMMYRSWKETRAPNSDFINRDRPSKELVESQRLSGPPKPIPKPVYSDILDDYLTKGDLLR